MPASRLSANHSQAYIRRKKRERRNRILFIAAALALTAGMVFGVRAAYKGIRGWVDSVMNDPTEPSETLPVTTEAQPSTDSRAQAARDYAVQLEKAEKLAVQYDFDGAIEVLRGIAGYENVPLLTEAIQGYYQTKASLVKVDIGSVYHIFFHSLIVDAERAFRSDDANGYNTNMTTVSEFKGILSQMYERGFVLVSLHDMAYTDASGAFVKGTIMLPEGKKPFVLSIDDVNYYEYMEGDGFARRITLDENGEVTNEMVLADGSSVYGSYDVMTILEDFIREHPDFAYKGARGTIALTGYDGIMGWRTAPKYNDPANSEWKASYASIDYAHECEMARKVAAKLKENGWTFASHSWGHVNMTNVDIGWLMSDSRKWEEQVDVLLGGDTDIMIFGFGADIGTWRNYTMDNEKFAYLKSLGFKYFCNVDSYNVPWVQFSGSEGYLRQGRVNLDGYEMYYKPDVCGIFFDAASVFDKARPLPVPKF